jgi:hypothetical protein
VFRRRNEALRGQRDMVKAGLSESQSPGGVTPFRPPERHPKPQPSPGEVDQQRHHMRQARAARTPATQRCSRGTWLSPALSHSGSALSSPWLVA